MTTARALAALLLCEAPQGDDACGQCDACRQLVVGTHPDCIIVEPDGKSIKIKQIRDLRARLSNTASYGGYTVVLIDDADTMGIEAANAFLKTVEEPVGPTCFVLVTTHADRLPDTIRSRAQFVLQVPFRGQYPALAGARRRRCSYGSGFSQRLPRPSPRHFGR